MARAGLDVSPVLDTVFPDPGFERAPGHFACTIISALYRSRAAAKLFGRGLSIVHSTAPLSTSKLTLATSGGPNPREHRRLLTDAGGIRSLALTSKPAVVMKDGVWAEVAPTVGVDVTLLVSTPYRNSAVVVPLNVTYMTFERSTDGKAHAMV